MPIQTSIVGSFDAGGYIAYNIKVSAGGHDWEVQKRYSDFEKLDLALASAAAQRVEGAEPMPERLPLPTKGTFGIRKMLNLAGFNEARQDNLEKYLQHISSQVSDVAQCSALEAFLQLPNQAHPLKSAQEVVAQAATAATSAQTELPEELRRAFPGAGLVFVPMSPADSAPMMSTDMAKPPLQTPADDAEAPSDAQGSADGPWQAPPEFTKAFPGAELVFSPILPNGTAVTAVTVA